MQSLRIRLHNLYARYADVTSAENAYRDMLADMRHLADDLGFDFGRLDKAAYEIYKQEAAQPAYYDFGADGECLDRMAEEDKAEPPQFAKPPAAIGTVIHGTMRPEDLIPAFIAVLESHEISDTARASIAEIEARRAASDYFDKSDCFYDVAELADLLDEIAPSGCYFGSHPGDGSDYGFWQFEEAEEAEEEILGPMSAVLDKRASEEIEAAAKPPMYRGFIGSDEPPYCANCLHSERYHWVHSDGRYGKCEYPEDGGLCGCDGDSDHPEYDPAKEYE